MVSQPPQQLHQIFSSIQARFVSDLQGGRGVFGHPGTKGDVSEREWVELLSTHLPQRYKADKAFVVDSDGNASDQMDVVIYDRHFTPLLYLQNNEQIIPAESVYAAFEVKQTLSKEHISYASDKIASVRRLKRTSAPIYYAGGQYPPRPLPPILGGLLTYESSFTPSISAAAEDAIQATAGDGLLELYCVSDTAAVIWNGTKITTHTQYPFASFYMTLVDMLQKLGSVPAIDYNEYLKHLL